jgi:hypothetical protein
MLVIAFTSILVLAIGAVMVDTQRGWLDAYAKVHGGAAADASMAKAAFDKVVRKASKSIYHLNATDDITVYYYDHWQDSVALDRYARFYRSPENDSRMYVQYGELDEGEKEMLSEVLLAANVTDLEFKPVSGGLSMKLALDDGREATTVVTTAILHNE